MPSPEPMSPEQQAILGALLRVERRLRLNRLIHTAGLAAGLALVGLVAWRVLVWLAAPPHRRPGLWRSCWLFWPPSGWRCASASA